MANEQNLKSFGERTASERREIAKKAGIASGKKRRHQRDLRKALHRINHAAEQKVEEALDIIDKPEPKKDDGAFRKF